MSGCTEDAWFSGVAGSDALEGGSVIGQLQRRGGAVLPLDLSVRLRPGERLAHQVSAGGKEERPLVDARLEDGGDVARAVAGGSAAHLSTAVAGVADAARLAGKGRVEEEVGGEQRGRRRERGAVGRDLAGVEGARARVAGGSAVSVSHRRPGGAVGAAVVDPRFVAAGRARRRHHRGAGEHRSEHPHQEHELLSRHASLFSSRCATARHLVLTGIRRAFPPPAMRTATTEVALAFAYATSGVAGDAA